MSATGDAEREMKDHAQDTEAHQANDRNFSVAIDLHVPEQGDRPI